MNATIIAVGKELLRGFSTNTNLKTIARRLDQIGINVQSSYVIDDKKEEYNRILDFVTEDIIIFTGGLGPTVDDITREVVLEYFDCETEVKEDILQQIKEYFASSDRTYYKTNDKQALFPKKSIVLKNTRGTAPGVLFKTDGKTIILFPGPPIEMKPMLDEVITYLSKHIDTPLISKGFSLYGIGESTMEDTMEAMYDKYDGVTIAPYASIGEIKYVFTSEDEETLDKAMGDFFTEYHEYIYGDLEDSLAGIVVDMLMQEDQTISVAESCTGGLVASAITSVSGASSIFKESLVTYSNEAKIKYLNVKEDTLKKHGAVSEETVFEMAKNLFEQTDAFITLAVSGIAGPTGGTKDKPVGLIYFALCYDGTVTTYKKVFNGTREMVRHRATLYALNIVRKELINAENYY